MKSGTSSDTSATSRPGDVLVIEDNAAFVAALRALVPGRLYAVGTLREAFHALRFKHWTRVLLDLELPDSSVEETISFIPHIRLAGHNVPVIVLTAYCVDARKLEMLGASSVIDKADPDCASILLAVL